MWLKLAVVGKSQQDSQQVMVVTVEISILQKHKLVNSLYKAHMTLGHSMLHSMFDCVWACTRVKNC